MDLLDEEALLERAREERQSIFERYDRGRSDLSQIDRWEDPSFEVYHQMDRYTSNICFCLLYMIKRFFLQKIS